MVMHYGATQLCLPWFNYWLIKELKLIWSHWEISGRRCASFRLAFLGFVVAVLTIVGLIGGAYKDNNQFYVNLP